MRTKLAVCAVVALSLSLGGCTFGQTTAPTGAPSVVGVSERKVTPPGELSSEQKDGVEPPEGFFDDPENMTVNVRLYDFAELAGYFYYCDSCLVSSVVEALGAPESMVGKLDGIPNVWVEFKYPLTTIAMDATPVGMSFVTDKHVAEPDEAGYKLSDADLALPVSPMSQDTTDPAAPLPRGLKIGASTREQVAAAYPAGSALTDERDEDYNYLRYASAWFSELDAIAADSPSAPVPDSFAYPVPPYWVGGITYGFDGEDVLSSVRVDWFIGRADPFPRRHD